MIASSRLLWLSIFLFPGAIQLAAQAHPATAGTKAEPQPSGPTVVIDTTLGRVTCKLFSQQAPVTVANFTGLADGSKDWTDGSTGAVMQGKPFYDGLAFNGVTDGVVAGDRLGGGKGVAGAAFPAEKSGLGYERAGRLIMGRIMPATPEDKSAPEMTSSSIFYILEHGDAEFARRGGTVFGQCDDASLPVVTAISHQLLSIDNHPATPLAINHISVLKPGDPMPPVAAAVAPASITPQPAPPPTADIPSPEPAGPTAIIDVAIGASTKGQLTCRLFQEETPIGTANFIGLVNGTKDWKSPATHALMHGKRFYDGLSFRRVIPDFMIQNSDMPGDPGGGGDIGFKFDNEIVPGLTFDRPGRLAYANGGPGTNRSEFFITEHPNHRLDGNYTIFGQCDDASVKLVESIARVPRDEHNRPLTPVMIRRITIVPAAK
jgi:cyclophilin family peptidyl-prolyl cis-trans isomerase